MENKCAHVHRSSMRMSVSCLIVFLGFCSTRRGLVSPPSSGEGMRGDLGEGNESLTIWNVSHVNHKNLRSCCCSVSVVRDMESGNSSTCRRRGDGERA